MDNKNLSPAMIKVAITIGLQQLSETPPESPFATPLAAQVLHAIFILKDKGHDSDELRAERARIFDQYGHEIIHMIQPPSEGEIEGVQALTELLLLIHRTLESPLDDADKLAHLREELFPPGRLEQIQDAAKQFGFRSDKQRPTRH